LKFARFIADLLEQLWNEDTLPRLEVEPSSSRLWRGGQLVALDLESIQFTYFSHIIAVTSWSADSYKYVARPAPSHTPYYIHSFTSTSWIQTVSFFSFLHPFMKAISALPLHFARTCVLLAQLALQIKAFTITVDPTVTCGFPATATWLLDHGDPSSFGLMQRSLMDNQVKHVTGVSNGEGASSGTVRIIFNQVG
jgi:hypothetical protein